MFGKCTDHSEIPALGGYVIQASSPGIRYFPDARNHKPPTFSRKIRGLCLLNVAVKERFETARPRFFKSRPPVYKGCGGAVCVKTFPWRSHGFVRQPVSLLPGRACVFLGKQSEKGNNGKHLGKSSVTHGFKGLQPIRGR